MHLSRLRGGWTAGLPSVENKIPALLIACPIGELSKEELRLFCFFKQAEHRFIKAKVKVHSKQSRGAEQEVVPEPELIFFFKEISPSDFSNYLNIQFLSLCHLLSQWNEVFMK